MKDESEIQAMCDKAADAAMEGSKYPGMSYEEGIREALDWVLGNIPDEDFSISQD